MHQHNCFTMEMSETKAEIDTHYRGKDHPQYSHANVNR